MRLTLRQSAFLCTGIAFLFWWSFEFAKHDRILSHIIPFGEDPYDAVSSFAAIAVVVLAFISLIRSMVPRLASRTPIYTLRAEAAIGFCILFTVSAEAVAMVRHQSMWAGKPGLFRLLILEACAVAFGIAILALTRYARIGSRSLFARGAGTWATALLILALYPEQLIEKTPGHLFTVVLGAVLLFAPVSALVKAWLPGSPSDFASELRRERSTPRYSAFLAATMIGSLIGACAYVAEASEGQHLPPLGQALFVGGVFIGLGACGIAIGYAFLGRLLGFGTHSSSV